MSNAQAVADAPYKTASWRHQILLFVGVFIGAWASIFTRTAQTEGISTPYIVAFRMIAGALALTPFVFRLNRTELRRLKRREVLFAAGAGFWFAIYLTAGFAALEHTTILISNVLSGTVPLWIALIETGFLKTRLSITVWGGLLFTLVGGAIITLSGVSEIHLGNNPPLGIILAITSAISGAIYLLIGRKSRDGMPFLPYLWLVFIFGGITALIEVLFIHAPIAGYSGKGYLSLIVLTLLAQLTTHTIFNYSVRHLPATYVGVANQLGVIISGILAFFFLNELPTPLQIPGSAAVIIGILLVNFRTSTTE